MVRYYNKWSNGDLQSQEERKVKFRNGRPLPALRGLPQALAGDVGEDALRGDPRPRPRVGAARRGRRDADAAFPHCRVGGDGKRRPDPYAATMRLPQSAGERGRSPLIPNLRASAPPREIKTPTGIRAKSSLPHDLESLVAVARD